MANSLLTCLKSIQDDKSNLLTNSPESSSRMTTCLMKDGVLSSASRTHSIFFCDVLDLRTRNVCKVTKVSKNVV